MIEDATEIQVRAERKLGELLAETEKAKGAQYGGKRPIDGARKEPSKRAPTLAEQGIDKKLSARAQQLAKVDAKDCAVSLDAALAEAKAQEGSARAGRAEAFVRHSFAHSATVR